MKKNFLLFACFLLSASVFAEISVKSFTSQPMDMTARIDAPVMDQNGQMCALIKVITTETNFYFDCGLNGVMKTVYKPSEIWVYVPEGTKRMTMTHEQLGRLSNYFFPEPVQKACAYEMELISGKVVSKVVENEVETQWFLLATEPDGADVYINNQPAGKTPYMNELPLGKYSWSVQKMLYESEGGMVELKSGGEKQVLNLTLKPRYGSFTVTSSPETGAAVSLDGMPTGKVTPCTLDIVLSGEHTVTVSKDLYETTSRKFTAVSGENNSFSIDMNQLFSDVIIHTDPVSDIYINGLKKGNGVWQGRIAPGNYTLEARRNNYAPAIERKSIVIGQPLELTLSPLPRTGSLKVLSTPFGARMKVDGTDAGTTPTSLKTILMGDHTVEISLPGYQTSSQTVSVLEGQSSTVNVNLQKEVIAPLSTAADTSLSVLVVYSFPATANFYLDDQWLHTGSFKANCTKGKHIYRVEAPGYRTETGLFEIQRYKKMVISLASSSSEKVLDAASEMPEYPGGWNQLSEFLSANMVYPVVAQENGIQGKTLVRFVVRGNGEISDVSILTGFDPSCDQEAMRVVASMPTWKPGKENGVPVSVYFTIPIVFKLAQ